MKKLEVKKIINGCGIFLVVVLMFGCEKYSNFNITEKPYIDKTSVVLYIGEQAGDRNQIQLQCSPSNRQYKWTSDVPEVATVSQNGLITAFSEGYAVITIASGNDETEVSVQVREFVPLTGFKLDRQSYAGLVGDITMITVIPEPANATEVNINWTSSNINIAEVYSNGLVKIVGGGACTITANALGIEHSITILTKIKIPRTLWTVPGYVSSVQSETIGYSSQHGGYVIMNLFDNNAASFWHAFYGSPASNYPHWFIVDMNENAIVTDVMLQRRQGFVSVNGFYFYTCPDVPVDQSDPVDGYPWDLQGEYEFNPTIDAEQIFAVPRNPEARYLKMYFDTKHRTPNAPNNYAQLAEFAVYGNYLNTD